MYLKDKTFKYLKNQSFFWQFQVTFHMYLDIDDEETMPMILTTKIAMSKDAKFSNIVAMSNIMMKSMC